MDGKIPPNGEEENQERIEVYFPHLSPDIPDFLYHQRVSGNTCVPNKAP
jgi:hypothetical protein